MPLVTSGKRIWQFLILTKRVTHIWFSIALECYEVIKPASWPCLSKYILPFSRPLDALSLGDFHNSPHQMWNSFIHNSCVKVYSPDIYQDNTQTFTAEMLMFKGYLSTLANIRFLFNWMIWFTLSKCPQLHAIDALRRCKSVFYTR